MPGMVRRAQSQSSPKEFQPQPRHTPEDKRAGEDEDEGGGYADGCDEGSDGDEGDEDSEYLDEDNDDGGGDADEVELGGGVMMSKDVEEGEGEGEYHDEDAGEGCFEDEDEKEDVDDRVQLDSEDCGEAAGVRLGRASPGRLAQILIQAEGSRQSGWEKAIPAWKACCKGTARNNSTAPGWLR